MVFILLIPCIYVISTAAHECSKNAKAETYLETAADLLNKLQTNFEENSRIDDCKCKEQPMDCFELKQCGNNVSGIYDIWPANRVLDGSIKVYCDMSTDNGGWTVIQRRGDYKRSHNFFYKNWQEYKIGFGDKRRDFWLGNNNIYALTNQKKYVLRIDLSNFSNETRNEHYEKFWIDNEEQNYQLHIGDSRGEAGDSLTTKHNGQMFSTLDRDNDNSSDKNCAISLKSGWWFNNCHDANLNGVYVADSPKLPLKDHLIWPTWAVALKTAEMKIRPMNNFLDLGVDIQ